MKCLAPCKFNYKNKCTLKQIYINQLGMRSEIILKEKRDWKTMSLKETVKKINNYLMSFILCYALGVLILTLLGNYCETINIIISDSIKDLEINLIHIAIILVGCQTLHIALSLNDYVFRITENLTNENKDESKWN